MIDVHSKGFREQIERLASAKDDELYSVLGLQSLPLTLDADQTLEEGRLGEFFEQGPRYAGGDKRKPQVFFNHKFKKLANRFFSLWADRLKTALCNNGQLKAQVQKSRGDFHLIVGAVVGTLAARLPELAHLTGLLTILGVLVARTGIEAFCDFLCTPPSLPPSQSRRQSSAPSTATRKVTKGKADAPNRSSVSSPKARRKKSPRSDS